MADLASLPSHRDDRTLNVVVESPGGSGAKLAYDPQLQVVVFKRALELGARYPYDWGFVPSTRAADDDPLDAMIVGDLPTYPGIVVPSVPIGIVRLTQRETPRAKPISNHRVIFVPATEPRFSHVDELPKKMRKELEKFFSRVGEMSHASVQVVGWEGPKSARKEIERACRAYVRHGPKMD